jgi:hypothetical protein
MDNHIITILQKFEKPDHNFLKDKECLICLESFDLESNKFIQLPCKCSNSTYHIDCIIKLINSGDNKNFCPHCKRIYEIPLQVQASVNQIVPYNVVNIQLGPNINYEPIKNFTHILVCHIISNSIMNVINIVVARNAIETNDRPELQVLMLFYFLKLFFNYVILMYSKNNIERIEDCLVYSYVFQTVLFCFFVYALTKIKNDYNSAILIVNNVFFSFGDLTFRVIIEYKMKNTVNVIG